MPTLGFHASVIRQKDEYQSGVNQKTNHNKFSEKRTFVTPRYAHVHEFCFVNTRLEICSFVLLSMNELTEVNLFLVCMFSSGDQPGTL